MRQCRVSFGCGWCHSFARDDGNRRRGNGGPGCDLVGQFMYGKRHGEIKRFSNAWREGGRGAVSRQAESGLLSSLEYCFVDLFFVSKCDN